LGNAAQMVDRFVVSRDFFATDVEFPRRLEFRSAVSWQFGRWRDLLHTLDAGLHVRMRGDRFRRGPDSRSVRKLSASVPVLTSGIGRPSTSGNVVCGGPPGAVPRISDASARYNSSGVPA